MTVLSTVKYPQKNDYTQLINDLTGYNEFPLITPQKFNSSLQNSCIQNNKLIHSSVNNVLDLESNTWDSPNEVLDLERGKQRAIEMDLDARLNEQYHDEAAYENLSHEENNSLKSDLTSIKESLAIILQWILWIVSKKNRLICRTVCC